MRGHTGRLGGAVGLAAIALATFGSEFARADEKVERFLPAETVLYGSVEKLGAALDAAKNLLGGALPLLAKELDEARLIAAVSEALRLQGVATREQLVAQTGLDLDGSAGVALVRGALLAEPEPDLNANILVILPVKDAARAEKVLAEAILPELPRVSADLCRAALEYIRRAQNRWQPQDRGRANATPTWNDLVKAEPGLAQLLCPAGGQYRLGRPGAGPACSIHGEADVPLPEGQITRASLGERKVGDVTLVGGRTKGTGYAITATHLIVSNNMNVLDAAVKAAAGEVRRADLAAPILPGAKSDCRAYLNLGPTLGESLGETRRPARRADTPAAQAASQRLATLLRGLGGLTLELRVARDVGVTATWNIARNEGTQAFLDIPPAPLGALALVPEKALLACGGNLARPILGIASDAMSLEDEYDRHLGPAIKLIRAACEGDAAFALTPGIFRELSPNMMVIAKVRDPELGQAVLEACLALSGRELEIRDPPEPVDLGGVPGWRLRLEQDEMLHSAFAGPYFVGATSLDDLKAAIELQAGRGKGSFVASERVRKLDLAGGPASLVLLVDTPAWVRQIAEGSRKGENRRQNDSCRQNLREIERLLAEYRAEQGQFPASLEELHRFVTRPNRHGFFTDTCPAGHGEPRMLVLVPARGKLRCPIHGTAADFRPVPIELDPQEQRDMAIATAFGLWGLRLRLEGGRLVGDGHLVPAPPK